MDLYDLQELVKESDSFDSLQVYFDATISFLELIADTQPTRIVSPTDNSYIFFQFSGEFQHKITRPLNTHIFCDERNDFSSEFDRFVSFLIDLKKKQSKAARMPKYEKFLARKGVERVIYTMQQSIGSIGDAFENPNQSRKRVGMLFEQLIMLVIKELGLECESRTIKLPLPGHSGYTMSYDLDLVISRNKAIIASETSIIGMHELIGSVKTTSKDRIDKVFLDKFMLSKFLGRPIPVIAIFLHDVQRAKKRGSIFGINSTFKSGHFLGYSIALNPLDGVYYVDPRPNMVADARLSREVSEFSKLLVDDLWVLTEGS